eukprot:scaffold402_cov70-Skeletonema_dohrnii-CCMP3373.AAC.3
MVSKKKARGKARKAAKAKKEDDVDNDSSMATAAAQQREQEGSLELQMQRLSIDTRSRFCMHGFVPFPEGHICDRFLHLYLGTYDANASSSEPPTAIFAAMKAVEIKYPEVLCDSSKTKQILSYFLMEGTHHILNGDKKFARSTAARIILLEEFIAYKVLKTQGVMHVQKVIEMMGTDDHTLVSFFRKRITCSCLDKKYREVKSIKKIGVCNNEKCPLPGRLVERRSKMLCCTRCSNQFYCSRDCQEAHWPKHKKFCKEMAEENAKFEQEMRIRDNSN